GGKGMRKEIFFSKEVVFTKFDVSASETYPEMPSDSAQRPLLSLPKLIGAEPSGIYAFSSNDIKVGSNVEVDGSPWKVIGTNLLLLYS
ncbi:hypothetical protein Tco_1433739, partial [Tanacetum coccineum]